jgi:hypothetical protein
LPAKNLRVSYFFYGCQLKSLEIPQYEIKLDQCGGNHRNIL